MTRVTTVSASRPLDLARAALLVGVIVSFGAGRPTGVLAQTPSTEVTLVTRHPDPYGVPRPAAGEQHVPLKTSLYFELGTLPDTPGDSVDPDSVEVAIQAGESPPVPILTRGRTFTEAGTGKTFPGKGQAKSPTLGVSIELSKPLAPLTRYSVRVQARSRSGGRLPAAKSSWSFTTEAAAAADPVEFRVDLSAAPVHWEGGFFTGFCKPSFTTSAANRTETYRLMAEVQKSAPRAWRWQRDFWMTGLDQEVSIVSPQLPNVVRERETRHITAIDTEGDRTTLTVEDLFGHEQYGVPANRPLADDFHAGDEILVGDPASSARSRVLSVDEDRKQVVVSRLELPAGQTWKLDYAAPPKTEPATPPGRFAIGGTVLRKFQPVGTPVYYWGRLDAEWDLAFKQFGHRLMPNFADAPGDLAIDGRNWTTAKDYAQLHEVTRTITGHLLDRYGPACLDFRWSVFNEPDLGPFFWRSDWNELQTFYDYTVDGVLKAFEEHGYDSDKVVIGGLELAAIFGPHLKLKEFLVHCSPTATGEGAILHNAAFADSRLDGKRSHRTEKLCRQHNGRGTPCDFVSIHAYNASEMMAQKLIRAKELALEVDPEYYKDLWVNSHESCPEWNLPPDPACGDSYLGNGYFPTWCADVATRLLRRGAEDPRYARGDSILTFWPWPNNGFQGGNDCVRAVPVDDDGDGRKDREVTIAMPILHFLGLLSRMGPDYWILPEQRIGGHVVSGGLSRNGDEVLVLLYSHNGRDTQSRSEAAFEATLEIGGLEEGTWTATGYRFDKEHNSYFELARSLRDGTAVAPTAEQTRQIEAAVAALQGTDIPGQIAALGVLKSLGTRAASALQEMAQLSLKATDPGLQTAAREAVAAVWQSPAYPGHLVRQVEEASRLKATDGQAIHAKSGRSTSLKTTIAANGASILVLRKGASAAAPDGTK